MKHDARWLAFAGVLGFVSILHAQHDETSTAPATASPSYEWTVHAGVWTPRLGGEVGDLFLEESFDLNSTEAVFNLEVGLRKDDYWQLDFSGFDFSTSSSGEFAETADFLGLDLNPGDSYQASFDMTSAAAELTWWLWDLRRIGEIRHGEECRVDLRFAPLVGVRYLDIDQAVDSPGNGTVEAGGEWLAAIVGLNLQMRYDTHDGFPLIDIFEIGGSGAVGPVFGGDGGAMAQIRAGMTAYLNPNIGLTFGYRLLEVDVENEPYEFSGGLQGLYFAATFRF